MFLLHTWCIVVVLRIHQSLVTACASSCVVNGCVHMIHTWSSCHMGRQLLHVHCNTLDLHSYAAKLDMSVNAPTVHNNTTKPLCYNVYYSFLCM